MEQIAAFIETLDRERLNVLGLSFGAVLAQGCSATTSETRPES